jgi:hypothetical protein
LFSRIWLGGLLGVIGGMLTPFWLLASIIFLAEPFWQMFPRATHSQRAYTAMASAEKSHIAALGIGAMIGGLILSIVTKSLARRLVFSSHPVTH